MMANGDQTSDVNLTLTLEKLEQWKKDPSSVSSSWASIFQSASLFNASNTPHLNGTGPSIKLHPQDSDLFKVQLLIQAYRHYGHFSAKMDPLGLSHGHIGSNRRYHLEASKYGWASNDLDRLLFLDEVLPFYDAKKPVTLRKLIETYETIYCGAIGFQYGHISDPDQFAWIRDRVESVQTRNYTPQQKRTALEGVARATLFEKFLGDNFPNATRFGLDGGESLLPGLKTIIDRSADRGVKSIVVAMPHRGRLNLLHNIFHKPIEAIMKEYVPDDDVDNNFGGDINYHAGARCTTTTRSGKEVSLSLLANPSHLESVNPVLTGQARAMQHFAGDEETRSLVLPILLHGDAAFSAQGSVYETLNMHALPKYTVGGTIHIIINNQIGFTTDPQFGRSTPYCTDIAKFIDAPVFHVNADDVEAVDYVFGLAADWRAQFKRDVFIDFVCYRRFGHSETDQPVTQPTLYETIDNHPTTLSLYASQLLANGTFDEHTIADLSSSILAEFEGAGKNFKNYRRPDEWVSSSWPNFLSPRELATRVIPPRPTGINIEILHRVGKASSTYPSDFSLGPTVAQFLANRGQTVGDGTQLSFSTAEALAFGSLALEKVHVWLSGQDVERGPAPVRHAVLHDQHTNRLYEPLNHIGSPQARVTVTDTALSENGALGFALGYSLVSPDCLTIWVAELGDFANNAQCIIDQYVASGEHKWNNRSGLVIALPHGFDGGGPDHSSGRMERYLQLCNDHPHVYPSPEKLATQIQDCNLQVVYPSTPANYFHVLRRQVHRPFRKPLVLLYSKSLLFHPLAKSNIEEMTGETSFIRYIPDPSHRNTPQSVRRHILCSGQVYYALIKEREERGISDVAVSRIEQLSPFPYDLIRPHLDQYPNAEIVWCQEEPLNSGAWTYVYPRLQTASEKTQYHRGKSPRYVGREPTSSVATSSKVAHKRQLAKLLDDAFAL